MNRSESKYFNTARRMAEALVALMEKKDFQYISVKEICAKAEVNRSTFYLHYENTADLLADAVEMIHERFHNSIPDADVRSSAISYQPRSELFFVKDKWLLPYLAFVRENKNVYKAIHTQMERFGAERVYKEFFEKVFSPILSRYGVAEDRHEYIMAFYRHGLVAVLMKWVEDDCWDRPEDIAAVIKLCIGEHSL